ncbi:MAG: winged helix-turn-helix transcriptional regulator, partial [Atopobiaceae bacterium]|nr:winged helix-turn-helix transcriptional regulator [Atopobiaceae bacterium]
LSDASRLRIVQSLTRGEMYTELLAERLGLSPSTVSFHLKKLEDAGIVSSR